ncbi:MAG: NAD(P)/FAD-dependent oxidoreductase [Bacteroidetes bacterium]|nr:NAD(P)/FAD-dependent oxidoreductase [Bacteroidota bacterium]
MIKEIQLQLLPAEADDDRMIRQQIVGSLSIKGQQVFQYEILRKSLDARSRPVKVLLKLRVYIDEKNIPKNTFQFSAKDVGNNKTLHIIGAGPAGLFCALQCIGLGIKPIIFERGKNVRDRRRDLAMLNKEGILNEESNYCFGEGGAGTYSDGKLYTRSTKRGNIHQVLSWFHSFGADASILYEAHPHIGTNKLPQIIESMRNMILDCGGEIHFNAKLTDIELEHDLIQSITINEHDKVKVNALVLATGHSAHDIYELLYHKKIHIESKPLAIGVRIEHPQALIDSIQYHCATRDAYLPPASYSLVHQEGERGVFSFCMCPGGIIAPASTRANTMVVNGWSPSKRNNPFANSGIVVSVNEKDFKEEGPLAGLAYQYAIEQKAFEAGGGRYVAPAQRMVDFSLSRHSNALPACSYLPGIKSVSLQDVLPIEIYQALAKAFQQFGKKMKGYYTNEAVVVATESRTSSPVRIPRDKENLQHTQIKNLYPCAEGAGYAGGIVSAAMDGMKVAEMFSMIK